MYTCIIHIQNNLKYQNLPLGITKIFMHDCNRFDSSKLLKNWTCLCILCITLKSTKNLTLCTVQVFIWFFIFSSNTNVLVHNSQLNYMKSQNLPLVIFNKFDSWMQLYDSYYIIKSIFLLSIQQKQTKSEYANWLEKKDICVALLRPGPQSVKREPLFVSYLNFARRGYYPRVIQIVV